MGRASLVLIVLTLAVAGCATPDEPTLAGADAPDASAAWQRVYVFDGQRGPVDPPATFAFDVPEGAQEVEALLTWTAPLATFGFVLRDASGEEAARGWNEAPGRAYVTTTHPVEPGAWTLEVSSERTATAAFAATVTVHRDAVAEGPIATSFVLPARSPTRALPPELRAPVAPLEPRDFAEINLNMAPSDFFTFDWTSTSDVYFNVHFHGEEGTERPIEHRGTALEGEFVANATEVYALLWRNEGNTTVEIDTTMQGQYRLHSMTRRG